MIVIHHRDRARAGLRPANSNNARSHLPLIKYQFVTNGIDEKDAVHGKRVEIRGIDIRRGQDQCIAVLIGRASRPVQDFKEVLRVRDQCMLVTKSLPSYLDSKAPTLPGDQPPSVNVRFVGKLSRDLYNPPTRPLSHSVRLIEHMRHRRDRDLRRLSDITDRRDARQPRGSVRIAIHGATHPTFSEAHLAKMLAAEPHQPICELVTSWEWTNDGVGPWPLSPSAICPWTPQHAALQRPKVTHAETKKKRPAMLRSCS